jgi:hypothetical protein
LQAKDSFTQSLTVESIRGFVSLYGLSVRATAPEWQFRAATLLQSFHQRRMGRLAPWDLFALEDSLKSQESN